MKTGDDLTLCSDEILLQRIVQGNKDALVTVFDRYAVDLYIYILPLLRTRLLNDHAEEGAKLILIAVFVTLWDNRETLSIRSTLSHHLFSEAYEQVVQFAGGRETTASFLQISEQ